MIADKIIDWRMLFLPRIDRFFDCCWLAIAQENRTCIGITCQNMIDPIDFFFWTGKLVFLDFPSDVIIDRGTGDKPSLPSASHRQFIQIICGRRFLDQPACFLKRCKIFCRFLIHLWIIRIDSWQVDLRTVNVEIAVRIALRKRCGFL